MSSKAELDEGIKSIKSAWQREHTARANLEKMLENAESENDKLRKLAKDMFTCISHANEQDWFYFEQNKLGCGLSCTVNGESCGLSVLTGRMRELGIEVD